MGFSRLEYVALDSPREQGFLKLFFSVNIL